MKYHKHEPLQFPPRGPVPADWLGREQSYTISQIAALANEYITELEKKTRLYQTMPRLDLSHFTLWLAKRERGEVRGR